MASEVDIANLALAHLGDDATVSSLNPPEGSAQAEHCARFYPIARDNLLAMHDWGFATKRTSPAVVDVEQPGWQYVYAKPSNTLKVIAVLPPGAQDDYSASLATQYPDVPINTSQYQTQTFTVEALSDGTEVICTNQEDATIRYVERVTDTTKFSALFVTAVARLLASYLAGPLIKGDAGRSEAGGQYKMFMMEFEHAKMADARQQFTRVTHNVAWMNGR